MRDTKESRLLLVLLVVVALALITVDIRGGENSPLDRPRQAAQSAFGPVENAVSGVVDPVGNAVDAVRDSGHDSSTIKRLQRENAALKQQLGSNDTTRTRAKELDKLLKVAGAGQYTVKGAQVIAIGAAQGFSWTVTIDAGSGDGLKRDMTVINGDGLVGRVTTVGRSTSTVLLANDPDFTVGTRLEKTQEIGFATGQGNRPMRVQLLDGKADVHKGDRVVTFGSEADKPFVPGVPVGKVVSVEPSAGNLTKTVEVQPYVGFTRLDVVGVVVVGPRTDPRDSVLPPRPTTPPPPTKPKPTNTPSPGDTPGSDTSTGTALPPGTEQPNPTYTSGG
ncbi:rod shape-determining protein MreC [Actinacidiphila yanglinensis]|uniref:Cell shape-determining protein MreC n=1 Tax=Actinacidiphila yanglinensis TaxID=310779 RepID=A0A1H6DMU4_9ACTN|nr:rod shape-determining protein MreC [Actinacidiphila yanglinensis]SEG86471.1 rod shape-determining protein MreC [Actinacidiphila yanglinensis]